MDNILLQKKEKLISDAITTLKQEFVGIDEQIDAIMDNLRTWFLFPELQSRPLVISIWGLTGTGKTSLVNRIAQLLDIERDKVYFNFAKISESSAWEIEQEIEDELSNERSNRLFVYDEFQYANTLDSQGEEKDKRSGLKPFWELLDTGIIHKRYNFYGIRGLYNVGFYLAKINERHPMEITNGVWTNAKQCLEGFSNYEIMKFKELLNFDFDPRRSEAENGKTMPRELEDYPRGYECSITGGDFFIKERYLDLMLDMEEKTKVGIMDRHEEYLKICTQSVNEIIDEITKIYDNASKWYDLVFNDSVIFVLGNLDEAYTVAFDVDPDMSPDQFHKMTKKINIVDIKKALQKRFRNEQIARLGNIHIIYPSFSSDSFKKIIDLSLNEYAKNVMHMAGYQLVFEQSVKDIIYKESVFPTHGTRPVFSTVHEIIKTKLPTVVRQIYEKNVDVDSIVYSYRRGKTIVTVKDKNGDTPIECSFKEKLRLEKLRDNTKDEEQALVAVHESGHFVMYAKLFGKMPEKVCSKTASRDNGGFMLKSDESVELHSFEWIMNTIKVSLGGYVAEKMVFGDEKRTTGASEDLRVATKWASRLVRDYGMGSHAWCTTYYTDGHVCLCGDILKEEDQAYVNEQIKSFFNDCLSDVVDTLNNTEWRKMLKASAQYLSTHTQMPKKKMLECYHLVDESLRNTDDTDRYYREKIENI
jgi:uncharacterized protein YktA (UPF0223 family)